MIDLGSALNMAYPSDTTASKRFVDNRMPSGCLILSGLGTPEGVVYGTIGSDNVR